MSRILVFICTILLIISVSGVNAIDHKNEINSISSNLFELIETDGMTENIVILNNEELTNMASANGWIGSGVGNDPYQIETEMLNSSISIISTSLAILIADQTFSDNKILLYNASNIEISSNNFENTYIDISYS